MNTMGLFFFQIFQPWIFPTKPKTHGILAVKWRQLQALGWDEVIHDHGLRDEGVGERHRKPAPQFRQKKKRNKDIPSAKRLQ